MMKTGSGTPYGISMCSSHSLVIIEGSVYGWGMNVGGQLGSGTSNTSTPKKIANLNNVVAVAWGCYHSMAMTKHGDVYMWGHNGNGQLGNGTTDNSKTPKKLNILANIKMIACSINRYSMALTNSGEVYSWGNNDCGQLGNGSTDQMTTPQKISNLTHIAAITCGYRHSIAMTKEGDVYSWGYNYYGQLGNGSTTSSNVPQKITNLTNVTAIACSNQHVLALQCDGDVYSWGHNAYGELGNGTTKKTLSPQKINFLTNIVAIACGCDHSMALTYDGSVYSWGRNGAGQLGIGSTTNATIPQKINMLENVYAIACIGNHSMALTIQGHLYVWGYNFYGQLGNGTNTNLTTPKQLSLPPGTLQWLRPPCSPLCPPLDPQLLLHMESLSNTLNLSHNVACDNHQFHSLCANQTQFHLHKAILAVRAPGLLKLKLLDISPTLFQDIINFIYTNTPLNFKNMKISQIIQLVHKCKSIKLMDLIPFCQQALMESLTNSNVFDAAVECHLLNLMDEFDWIAWFIEKNKLSPITEAMNLSNPAVLSKLKSQLTKSPPPMFSIQPRPLKDVLGVIYSKNIYTDFSIHFKNTLINVHKFVLSPRWPYFTNIMLKNQLSTVHNSSMPPDIFGKLIQYFYVGAKYLDLRDCGWILYLSEFYLLHDEISLLEYCDKIVNSQIYLNWPSALQLAMEIHNEDIEKKAILMIQESTNPKQIISLCLGFAKHQQNIIQEQQKTIQEHQRVLQEQKRVLQEQQGILNNFVTDLTKFESLLSNK